LPGLTLSLSARYSPASFFSGIFRIYSLLGEVENFSGPAPVSDMRTVNWRASVRGHFASTPARTLNAPLRILVATSDLCAPPCVFLLPCVYHRATWRPVVRTVAARGANRRGPTVFGPSSLFLYKAKSSPLLLLLAFPTLRALCLLLSAPPSFFVHCSPLELRRPANSRRSSAGTHRAEIRRSAPVSTAAFTLPCALLRTAVDGVPRRPQAHCFSGEPLLQQLRRLRLGPNSVCFPFACFPDLGSMVFLFPLFF
jgi:hypothetical protein